jgi:hypothetical protein
MENFEQFQSLAERVPAGTSVELKVLMPVLVMIIHDDEVYETRTVIREGMALPRKKWAIMVDGAYRTPQELKAKILGWRYF